MFWDHKVLIIEEEAYLSPLTVSSTWRSSSSCQLRISPPDGKIQSDGWDSVPDGIPHCDARCGDMDQACPRDLNDDDGSLSAAAYSNARHINAIAIQALYYPQGIQRLKTYIGKAPHPDDITFPTVSR